MSITLNRSDNIWVGLLLCSNVQAIKDWCRGTEYNVNGNAATSFNGNASTMPMVAIMMFDAKTTADDPINHGNKLLLETPDVDKTQILKKYIGIRVQTDSEMKTCNVVRMLVGLLMDEKV